MMNRRQKYILIIGLPIVVLFSMWAINTYINEKRFDNDKAALFDECMESSYLLIKEAQKSILVLIDFYEDLAYKTKEQNPYDFKVQFIKNIDEGFKENPSVSNAFLFLNYNNLFLPSAVCHYLEDGGKQRAKYSQAIYVAVRLWVRYDDFPDKDYDELLETLRDDKKDLLNSMAVLSEYKVKPNMNMYAFREIEPLSKLYIWERHNERKNWPIKSIINFLTNK